MTDYIAVDEELREDVLDAEAVRKRCDGSDYADLANIKVGEVR